MSHHMFMHFTLIIPPSFGHLAELHSQWGHQKVPRPPHLCLYIEYIASTSYIRLVYSLILPVLPCMHTLHEVDARKEWPIVNFCISVLLSTVTDST